MQINDFTNGAFELFGAYLTWMNVVKLYKDKKTWAKMAIMNTASMGKFNSDRAILDYVKNIWGLDSCHIE